MSPSEPIVGRHGTVYDEVYCSHCIAVVPVDQYSVSVGQWSAAVPDRLCLIPGQPPVVTLLIFGVELLGLVVFCSRPVED